MMALILKEEASALARVFAIMSHSYCKHPTRVPRLWLRTYLAVFTACV